MRAQTHRGKIALILPPPHAPRCHALRAFAACLGAIFLSLAFCGCNSMNGHLNNQLGMWDYQQGNYTAARVAFRRALADDPQNASFAYNLACAMKRQGDLSGAEQAYVQAINIDRSHQPAYHGLAQLLCDEGRTAEATQMISSWAQAQSNHAGAQIELAWIQRRNGDAVAAEQSLYRALAIRPDDPIATAQLGQLYQETGQTERAAAMYQRSLRSNWLQPQVQSRLAMVRNPAFGPAAPMFAWDPGAPAVAGFPATPAYAAGPTPVESNDQPNRAERR